MSFNSQQFNDLIVTPVLQGLGMWSSAAVNLMLGTCAKESAMGTYLKQVGGGPALGVYQVEPATHDDVWRYLNDVRPDIREKVLKISVKNTDALIYNLYYATAIARIRYWYVEEKLPAADNITGLGLYWDKYYNCNPNKGTVGEFVDSYRRYVR